MVTIVGLGNPGYEYEETRHNVGFMVVDALCESLGARLAPGKGDYLIETSVYKNQALRLIKPLTYMNNSGLALLDLKNRYDFHLDKLLVVCDDFNLPLGRIRLRPGGSDGGHNGLYSIIYHLETEKFPRLRCGIGQPKTAGSGFNTTEFVLSVFDKDEQAAVQKMIGNAHAAALSFVAEGIVSAMDRWNTPEISSPDGLESTVQ